MLQYNANTLTHSRKNERSNEEECQEKEAHLLKERKKGRIFRFLCSLFSFTVTIMILDVPCDVLTSERCSYVSSIAFLQLGMCFRSEARPEAMRQVKWKARDPRRFTIETKYVLQSIRTFPSTEFHGYPESVQSDGTISYILLTFFLESCFPTIIHGNVEATDFARQTCEKFFQVFKFYLS